MTLPTVVWSDDAERDLLAMPPFEAERTLDAVDGFVATGRGFLRVLLDGSDERRLYLTEYCVHMSFDGSQFRVLRALRR